MRRNRPQQPSAPRPRRRRMAGGLGPDANRQRPPRGRVGALALADEGLDDLQRRSRFALGSPSLEVRRQFARGPQDFLVANLVVGRSTRRGGTFSKSTHRHAMPVKTAGIVARPVAGLLAPGRLRRDMKVASAHSGARNAIRQLRCDSTTHDRRSGNPCRRFSNK